MKEKAYAKINLCIDVVRKREDGYHDLEMVMLPIDYFDWVIIEKDIETTFKSNAGYLPINDKNTVIKAINIIKKDYNITDEFRIEVIKHIPTRGGLAGGSADGAAAIRIMNRMYNLKMSQEKLIEIGKRVGSDVPFCIFNRCAYVSGTGDTLEMFDIDFDYEILLVKPGGGIATPRAFNALNIELADHPDCKEMMRGLIEKDHNKIKANLLNSLEEPALRINKKINAVKNELKELGFDLVLMSGSGATVFALSKDKRLIREAHKIMKSKKYFTRATKTL
ncbi:MAG: 4-(cytidine 5'-diphospho)-2-C-methyl-D-erythritol kinase [Anaerorhabdus sp.]